MTKSMKGKILWRKKLIEVKKEKLKEYKEILEYCETPNQRKEQIKRDITIIEKELPVLEKELSEWAKGI